MTSFRHHLKTIRLYRRLNTIRRFARQSWKVELAIAI
jgi:hypothetical protein